MRLEEILKTEYAPLIVLGIATIGVILGIIPIIIYIKYF